MNAEEAGLILDDKIRREERGRIVEIVRRMAAGEEGRAVDAKGVGDVIGFHFRLGMASALEALAARLEAE